MILHSLWVAAALCFVGLSAGTVQAQTLTVEGTYNNFDLDGSPGDLITKVGAPDANGDHEFVTRHDLYGPVHARGTLHADGTMTLTYMEEPFTIPPLMKWTFTTGLGKPFQYGKLTLSSYDADGNLTSSADHSHWNPQ